MLETILAWLLTYLLHSTILLGLAWLLDAAGILRRPQIAETVWRIALFGGMLTATLQAPLQHWFHGDSTVLSSMRQPMSISAPDGASSAIRTALPTLRVVAGLPNLLAPSVPPTPPLPPLAPEPPAAPAIGDVLSHPDAVLVSNTLGVPIAQAAPFVVVPWLLLATLGCLQIALSVRRLNAGVDRCPEVDDDDIDRFISDLSGRHGRKPPRVRIADHWKSPLVSPCSDICVPSWVLNELDRPQREAVLAHEVAHVIRRDPLWRVASRIVVRIGILQPLNIVALRRLDAAAEYASDEWSARASSHRALAEALFACAERFHLHAAPSLTPAAIDCSSSLLSRVDSLLTEESKTMPTPVRVAVVTAFIACAAAVVAMPVIAINEVTEPPSLLARSGELIINIHGDIAFADNEQDVRSVTGFAVFEQTVSGKKRSIRIEPDDAGGVRRTYKVDGAEHAFDAEGQTWLAGLIPNVLRGTALNAEERIARLLRKGGDALVLDEIRQIDNDFARSRYIAIFATHGALRTDDVTRLLALAAGIRSDVDRGRTYEAIIRRQTLDTHQLSTLVSDLDLMRSDVDKHIVLDALAPRVAELAPHDTRLSTAYVNALQHIQSPIDRSATLVRLIQTTTLDHDGYAMVLSATEGMSADIETCQVLLAVAAGMPADADLIRRYRKIASTLGDFERAQAETALGRFGT